MSTAWQQISAVVTAETAGSLSDAMEAAGALAVTMLDASDEPLYEPPPGATPLWQATRVQGLFSAEADFETLTTTLASQLQLTTAVWQVETVADQAWERVWMDRFHPMRFGEKLWICPTHREVPEGAQVVVRLDPGLAFGTGTHPTTALCLQALDAAQLAGIDVIDYGCGSGVLAIAALKLGARTATGIDIDPQALSASRANAERNDVSANLKTASPAEIGGDTADAVIANILAGPLIELAPTLTRASRRGALLVLSGILASQADDVMRAYTDQFQMLPVQQRDEWVCLTGHKR